MSRPLSGLKVIEFAGLAPGPFAGMVLSDFGADVIRIDKPGDDGTRDTLARGKKSISISPKTAAGRDILLKLVSQADVLIEPFRPGIMEKLGLGPDVCLKKNKKLIYARMTGFMRTGPYANAAGHDINYLALSGVLSMMRPQGKAPFPPLNLLADFAGGGLMCVQGILLALIERGRSGEGQVVEADMVTGTRYVSSFPLLQKYTQSQGLWAFPTGSNVLDGGAPFYSVYETKDGKYMSVGALEPKFYSLFLRLLHQALLTLPAPSDTLAPLAFPPPASIDYPAAEEQFDRQKWPELRQFFEIAFKTKTREEWTEVFGESDSCVVPVLEPREAARISPGGNVPTPAPSLTRTPGASISSATEDLSYLPAGKNTLEILRSVGIKSEEEISRLKSQRVIDFQLGKKQSAKL